VKACYVLLDHTLRCQGKNRRHVSAKRADVADEMSEPIYKIRRFIQNARMSEREEVLGLLSTRGVLRPRDVVAQGLRGASLWELAQEGLVERLSRGSYRLIDHEPTGHEALIHVAARVPGSVVCLLSALSFHLLTTQLPFQVWIAVGPRDRHPRLDWPPLRVVRFSGAALNDGRERHVLDGVPLWVFSPAKTVADCFKYRNKIGLDVAIEAARDAMRDRKATVDELVHFARVCRVWNVMRPYLEALA